jgi:hypothetical protein
MLHFQQIDFEIKILSFLEQFSPRDKSKFDPKVHI